MSVYVFNLLVGFSPNGIDNAQGYREKMFGQIGLDSKYVFTEFPNMRDIMLYKKYWYPSYKNVDSSFEVNEKRSF